MMKILKVKHNEKTVLEAEGADADLFLLNLDGQLVIMSGNFLQEMKVKKGSISFRTQKGMKTRTAIKDLIGKARPQKTECLVIDLKGE